MEQHHALALNAGYTGVDDTLPSAQGSRFLHIDVFRCCIVCRQGPTLKAVARNHFVGQQEAELQNIAITHRLRVPADVADTLIGRMVASHQGEARLANDTTVRG